MIAHEHMLRDASELADLYNVPTERVAELQADLPGPVRYQLGYLAGRTAGALADVARVHYEDCDRRDACRTCTGLAEASAVNLAGARTLVDDHLQGMLKPRWQFWR
jgi:hypothetical protein